MPPARDAPASFASPPIPFGAKLSSPWPSPGSRSTFRASNSGSKPPRARWDFAGSRTARATCTAAELMKGNACPTSCAASGSSRSPPALWLHAEHPLLSRSVTEQDLVHSPWVDCDPPATGPRGNDPSSLDRLLEHLYETTRTRVRTVARSGSAGLSLLASGDYLTWLPLTFLERLRGRCLQPVSTPFGRHRYRSGFVARRSAEDLPPFRKLETMVREIALASKG